MEVILTAIRQILDTILSILNSYLEDGYVDSFRFHTGNNTAIDATMREKGFNKAVRSITIHNEGPEPLVFRIPYKRESYSDGRLVGGQTVTFNFDRALLKSVGLQCETAALTTDVQIHGRY